MRSLTCCLAHDIEELPAIDEASDALLIRQRRRGGRTDTASTPAHRRRPHPPRQRPLRSRANMDKDAHAQLVDRLLAEMHSAQEAAAQAHAAALAQVQAVTTRLLRDLAAAQYEIATLTAKLEEAQRSAAGSRHTSGGGQKAMSGVSEGELPEFCFAWFLFSV